MAFCPNCGTPNTDQAEKCVACGFELIVPKQKAKFKGTIMMSGIKAPTLADLAGATPMGTPTTQTQTTPTTLPATSTTSEAPTSQETEPHAATPAEPARNLNYNKTMLGHAPVLSASPVSPSPTAAERPLPPRPGLDRPLGSTMLGSAAIGDPQLRAPLGDPPVPGQSPAASGTPLRSTMQSGAASPGQSPMPSIVESAREDAPTSSGGGGYANAPRLPVLGAGGYESTLPPPARSTPPNPATVLGIGCAVALVLFCVVGGILYYVVGAKLKAMLADGDNGAEAAAWQASIVQSLAQVSELCKTDCAQAGVYFHPQKEAALLPEAKALTSARLQKLSDPTQTQASMLDGTDDAELATKLGLDPQQCARVSLGAAKVVSCSVPDPTGQPSVLRIVHLGGITTL